MPVEWVTLTKLSRECGIDKRTFMNHYMEDNPPQIHLGVRRSWTRDDADRIKRDVFGIKIKEDK